MTNQKPQTVSEAVALIDAVPVVGEGSGPVEGVYCSDLLSDVLANAPENSLWITVQNHRNIVAVAETRDVAAIVVAGGRPVLDDTKRQAKLLEVPIYSSPLTVYEIAGRLYSAGVGRDQS
ncbi:MAG TPA: serine kinase [bacterium]|mgnify:FL=1|nr:serine kinase [bacterium]